MYRITAKTITFSQVIFFKQQFRTKKVPHRFSGVLCLHALRDKKALRKLLIPCEKLLGALFAYF